MNWEIRTLLLLVAVAVLGTIQDGMAEKKIVCYYTNWSIYRPGTAKFSPQNINPYLCTHLIYAFGGFTKDNALKPFDKYQDIEKGGYAKFTGLKTYNKNLKTMLAIGGWNEGSSRFSPMLADPARRKELVKNSIKFLRQNHFDGLDLDWEYPAFRDGGKPHDKNNYANFVQELYEEFERESKKTGRPRLLLSMAVPAGIEYIDKGYDVPRLNEYLDFINLLSYDYHSAYEPAVNHHAPLYPLEEDNEYNYDSELTINYTINHLIKSGASTEKIILGIPTYGRSYTLFNEDATDLGSPADGPGIEGDDTREKGYLAYYEICESVTNSDDWEVIQPNPKAMGPYAFKGNQWVGYDDVDIVRLKARFINQRNLGGMMFWSIDNDDFRGKCHDRPYPLIEAGKETLLIEDTRNVAHKPKSSDSRKKSRVQSTSSNSLRRKVNSNVRRSTTSVPVTRKQTSTTSKPKYRTISRTRLTEDDDDDDDDRELERRSYEPSSSVEDKNESGNVVRSTDKKKRSRNRNKTRNRSSTGRRRKPARNEDTNDNDKHSTTIGESLSNKLTTPEPPTTPDPGTDFKCEDEGFYPHPRECKKYFWCLDSGPGGLGLVVYQFTCPAGLVFNKAADSCDYPRNVVCPKAKTTETTTRAPITAATSRTTYLHSTTQRTTTTKSDSEEDEEYYDDEEEIENAEEEDDEEEEEEEEEVKVKPKITSTMKPLQYKTITRNKPSTTASTTTSTTSKPGKDEEFKNGDLAEEEDPKVIKELINLIRKAGGIEELEKQLHLQDKGTGTSYNNDPVTPATISRTLYERVLSRQASKIVNSNVSGSSEKNNYRNGPGKAQFEGLDELPEVKSLRRAQKPQYVTIERPKVSTNAPQLEDEEIDDNDNDDHGDGDDDDDDDDEDDELDDFNTNVASSEDETISNPSEISTSTQRVTANYVNIRRNRFSTTTSKNENDVEEKADDPEEEIPIRRRRPNGSTKNQDKESENNSKPFRTRTKYRNKEGNRNGEGSSEQLDSDEKAIQGTRKTDHEINTATTKSRYINIQRFRSTTQKNLAGSSDNFKTDEITTEGSTIKNKIDEDEDVTTTSTTPTTFSTISSTTTAPTSTITTQSILSSVSVTPIYSSSSSSSSSSTSSLSLLSSTSTSTSSEATSIKINPIEETSIANNLNNNNYLIPSTTTTDSPVKLVEESATEILLTTAPASPSPGTPSVLSTTRLIATVSQPRPFGFTRRRLGSVTADVTTTPLAPTNDNSRSKVSITSRNSTRSSSFLAGRGRLKTRTDSPTRITVNKRINEQEQLENPTNSEETFNKPRETGVNRSRTGNKRRGINRYNNSSTTSPITEDISKNTISRRRSRTTESPNVTTAKTITESSNPRRRYRRPSIQSTTETTKTNELEDSPIVRITQVYNSRSKKFRSKSDVNLDKDENEKITNIRVFKQSSPSINKELYGRTRNPNKRNYVDTEQVTQKTTASIENNEQVSVSVNDTATGITTAMTTIKEIEQSTTESPLSTVQITDNDTTNTINNDLDASSTPIVTEIEESNTSVQPGPEFDTIASTYYITESTTESNTVSTDSSNVSYETSANPEETYTTSNIFVQSISPSINKNTEMNENEMNIDTVDSAERKLINQRRKKVILRRRPVNNNNDTSTTTMQKIEENSKHQVNRRRKVLKRIRLLNGKSSTVSFESSSSQEEELSSFRSEASSEMNTFQSDNMTDQISTELLSEEIQETDNVTESLSTFATEFPNIIDYTLTDSSSESNLETSTMTTDSTKDDNFISDPTTTQTTIMDATITDTLTTTTISTFSENEDLYSTVITTEPTITPSTSYIDNTFDPEETRLATENVTAIVQTTIPSFPQNLEESQIYSKSSPSETRYVRKKFVRKRPVLLPETPNSRYAVISRPYNRALSTTERNEIDVNELSKRRKSLLIRRRPISSTTRTTEELDINNEDVNETEEEEKQDEQDFSNSDDVDDTTTKDIINSASVENESLEFWKHYTTPAEGSIDQRPSPPSDQIRNTYLTTEPSITTYPTLIKESEEFDKDDSKISGNVNKLRYVTINRRPESRRAYKVPSSIKNLDNVKNEKTSTTERILSTKRWYPIDDSSPEETEENPETKEAIRLRFSSYRQARARYRNYEDKLQKDRLNKEIETTPSYFEYSTSSLRSRYQTKHPITPVEVPVTETLIPAKKFDYAADAFHRKQQSLRTTTPQQREEEEEYTTRYQNDDNSELLNLVEDSDKTTTPSNKPLVTRLVTSIAESGTTERQKILIKTKYSSLTSTTRIPVQNVISRNLDYPSTTQSLKTLIDRTNDQAVTNLDESINEIRPAIEASTLPIESEFVNRANGRFTTESHESSTIPIESVFSNLIAGTKEH